MATPRRYAPPRGKRVSPPRRPAPIRKAPAKRPRRIDKAFDIGKFLRGRRR